MPDTKLLIATHNQGKVREYRSLLADLQLEVTYLDAEGITLDVKETGETFEENAVMKAQVYAEASGLLTWADDSGLEVDALAGAPGVRSARYGAPAARSDKDRWQLLLKRMAPVPDDARAARFQCVVALATPQGAVRTTSGVCEGRIGRAPRGDHGFGYDPVFLVADTDFQLTMAELQPDHKNRISHRGHAAQAAKQVLVELIDSEKASSGW
ncbi:MAG: RdgB/HAM1 family non-canonical purine NTP pyrophosphatase [Chloroflexota bacterium]|nr:RdgB/HAM1 family non-canonical purine NTP pyrophosphatase [Chloroflexota bacterium]